MLDFYQTKIWHSIIEFSHKLNGSIAIIFAVSLPVFIALATIGIEVGRYNYAKTRLSAAVDAAAIAAARYNISDVKANGLKAFFANFESGFMGTNITPSITASADGTKITVTAGGSMPTIIGKYLGVTSLNLQGFSEVSRIFQQLELALVLDTTGSMASSGKMPALIASAQNLIDVLYEGQTSREGFAISIVPYVAAVNVGANNVGWLSDPASATKLAAGAFVQNSPTNLVWRGFPAGEGWKGCVKARIQPGAVGEENDTPPGGAGTKWPTYFTPSTLLFHSNSTQWDNDWRVNAAGTVIQVNPIIDSGIVTSIGPNRSCGQPIQPLINDSKVLKSQIATLSPIPGGGTFGNLGLAWGWRTISPSWKGMWGGISPKDYTAPNNIKAIVIETDGQNQWYNSPGYLPDFDVTAYETMPNPPSDNRLNTRQLGAGVNSAATATTAINNSLSTLCTRIKAQGIEIYTVVLMTNDPTTLGLYRQCATDANHAFVATSTQELYDHFKTIANQLKRIRIVK